MEQKKNDMIVEMVEKLRQMDSNSLVIMKASVDILAAKERLDKEEAKTAQAKQQVHALMHKDVKKGGVG